MAIKVMIVDDSAVVRQVMQETLSKLPISRLSVPPPIRFLRGRKWSATGPT